VGKDRRLANAGFLDSMTQQVLSHLQRYLFCRNTKFATDPMADAHGQTILIGGTPLPISPEEFPRMRLLAHPPSICPPTKGLARGPPHARPPASTTPPMLRLPIGMAMAWKYWVSL